MPEVSIDPDLNLHYEDDYFGEPWRDAEAVLLIHGVAESGRAWFAWVPHLARSFRVLRPDLRGFGRSSVPPPGYQWSPAAFVDDLRRLLDALQLGAVHVVGAKLGGSVAMLFAATYPDRTRTLSVVSSPVRAHGAGGGQDLRAFAARVEAIGARGWAAETQRARLGSAASDAQIDWWNDFMGATDPRVCADVTAMAGTLDIGDALPRIQAPSLVITTEKSALNPPEAVRAYQEQIPNSRLLVLGGDSYHVAAAEPDTCAGSVLAFIEQHAPR